MHTYTNTQARQEMPNTLSLCQDLAPCQPVCTTSAPARPLCAPSKVASAIPSRPRPPAVSAQAQQLVAAHRHFRTAHLTPRTCAQIARVAGIGLRVWGRERDAACVRRLGLAHTPLQCRPRVHLEPQESATSHAWCRPIRAQGITACLCSTVLLSLSHGTVHARAPTHEAPHPHLHPTRTHRL
jgi:hypothetical protein